MKYEANNFLEELKNNKIEFKLFEHEAFFTVEESSSLKKDFNMQGAHTKNLFLRDKKRNFFLISCLDDREVDLKQIKNTLPCQGNLSFGSSEYLYEKLGVRPGSVSPYALINNLDKDVSFYLDKEITKYEICNFHPLDNTKTIQVKMNDFLSYIKTLTKITLIDFGDFSLSNL